MTLGKKWHDIRHEIACSNAYPACSFGDLFNRKNSVTEQQRAVMRNVQESGVQESDKYCMSQTVYLSVAAR